MFRKNMMVFVLDVLSLRYLWGIQVELHSTDLKNKSFQLAFYFSFITLYKTEIQLVYIGMAVLVAKILK